jgi:hypothetical protein
VSASLGDKMTVIEGFKVDVSGEEIKTELTKQSKELEKRVHEVQQVLAKHIKDDHTGTAQKRDDVMVGGFGANLSDMISHIGRPQKPATGDPAACGAETYLSAILDQLQIRINTLNFVVTKIPEGQKYRLSIEEVNKLFAASTQFIAV